MCKLLFAGIPPCLSFPALKYIELIYYHTCCPQGVFQNDLSLTQHYYHSPQHHLSHIPSLHFSHLNLKGLRKQSLITELHWLYYVMALNLKAWQ